MINDPTITATCDNCGYTTDEMEMCALAGGGWDDRYIESKLTKWGWTIDGDKTYCEDCSEGDES